MSQENLNGVYIIKNTVNNKIYIGSTANVLGFRERWRCHLGSLRRGKHCNVHLQRAFVRDGEAAFQFEILLVCSKEECKAEEQKALNLHKSYNPDIGYNICKKAKNTLGRKHSEETRKKIGANRIYKEPWNKGKKMSLESRLKMSLSQKNSPACKAQRENLAKNRKLKSD